MNFTASFDLKAGSSCTVSFIVHQRHRKIHSKRDPMMVERTAEYWRKKEEQSDGEYPEISWVFHILDSPWSGSRNRQFGSRLEVENISAQKNWPGFRRIKERERRRSRKCIYRIAGAFAPVLLFTIFGPAFQ